jgi:hypothetical protein
MANNSLLDFGRGQNVSQLRSAEHVETKKAGVIFRDRTWHKRVFGSSA